ncbi:MAG: hypothetical protein EHM93_17210 [Bacteroidales bacterium]|nr:MAG: hypothetical protein EHM93_17210 [Bacteroidales bacterium]
MEELCFKSPNIPLIQYSNDTFFIKRLLNMDMVNPRNRANTRITFCLLCVLVIFFSGRKNALAQDIEAVIKAPVLASNGGLTFSQISTLVPGDTTGRYSPYTYYLTGNLNLNFFSVVNVPMSFAYTNNLLTKDGSLPFNRFSIAPSYKWITLYLGYSSMTFSPYTLVGREVFGSGVELTFDNGLKFGAIYGRMQKEVMPDSNLMQPAYRRLGGGFKVEYSNQHADIAFNVFKAKDVANPMFFNNADSIITPMDNISSSILLNVKMIENLKLNVEYAISAVNSDISKNDSLPSSFNDKIIEQNGDLSVHHAVKASISQTSKIGVIGASYERVSPNYNTFGAYYMANDYRNITANFSTSIKQWLNFAIDAGFQRDNLVNQKLNTNKRFILSTNASSAINSRLNVGVSYSNVQSFTHIKDVYDQVTQTNQFQNLDTLSFSQLNLTVSGNVSYVLKSTKDSRQSVNTSFTYQEASEQQNNQKNYSGSRIYNSALSYQFSLIPQKFNASTSVNYNHNQMQNGFMGVMSYNLSLQKAFFELIKVGLIGTYSQSFNDTLTLAKILNLRLSAGITLQKRHNFNLSVARVNSKGLLKDMTQFTANLSYSYMFDFNFKRNNRKLKYEGNF